MTAAKSYTADQILIGDDGTIIEPRIGELYAMAIAEGEDSTSAWKASGGSSTAYHAAMRSALDTHAGFKARVDALAAERAEVTKDAIYGKAIWMIEQGFRESRAKRDRGEMMEYAKLRLQAAQGVAKLQEQLARAAEATGGGPRPANPVGKPTEKSPQSTRGMDDIRTALREKGLKLVPKAEDEDE